jgi:hypothetical protein
LHGNIRIDAFDRFVNEANHAGSLTGTVGNGPAFGKACPRPKACSTSSTPAARARRPKHFIYEAASSRRQILLSCGHKDVLQGGDLWGDTTTSTRGCTKAAGRQRQGHRRRRPHPGRRRPGGLLRTVKVHNASNEAENLAVVIRFFRLFLGNLWDSYARFIPGLP